MGYSREIKIFLIGWLKTILHPCVWFFTLRTTYILQTIRSPIEVRSVRTTRSLLRARIQPRSYPGPRTKLDPRDPGMDLVWVCFGLRNPHESRVHLKTRKVGIPGGADMVLVYGWKFPTLTVKTSEDMQQSTIMTRTHS